MKWSAAIPTLVLTMLGLAGCDQEWRWHQKLTVTIDTPDGPKSASSVQEGTIVEYGWWQRQWGYGGGAVLTGEAVVLETAPGKYLFALLKGTPLAWTVFLGDKTPIEVAGPALERLRETRTLSPKQYPIFVTFEDINKPTSVKRVDPIHLDAKFGPGFRLRSVSMTITDEAATIGKVEKLLDWLGQQPEPKLGPATKRATDIPFYRQVSHGDFIRR